MHSKQWGRQWGLAFHIGVTVKNAQDWVFCTRGKNSASADLQGLSLRATALSSRCASKSCWRQLRQDLVADGVKARVINRDQQDALKGQPQRCAHCSVCIPLTGTQLHGCPVQDMLVNAVLLGSNFSANYLHCRGNHTSLAESPHLPIPALMWVRKVTSVTWSSWSFFSVLSLVFPSLLIPQRKFHTSEGGHLLPVV